MFEYKTEKLETKTKWLSSRANKTDMLALDELFNERASQGWELVTYCYMLTELETKGATLITFRKPK
jgi:hypothetical protein